MAKKIIKLDIPEPQELRDSKTLGDFIRAARTNSNLTIEDAAALCGVSLKTMANLENAKADIRLSTIFKVCASLGITLRIEA